MGFYIKRLVPDLGRVFGGPALELNNVRPVEGWRARLAARGAVAEAGRRASSFSSATDLWCEACPTRPAHPPRFPCPYAERDVGLLYRLDGGREASSSASGAAAIRMLNKAQTGHRHMKMLQSKRRFQVARRACSSSTAWFAELVPHVSGGASLAAFNFVPRLHQHIATACAWMTITHKCPHEPRGRPDDASLGYCYYHI